MLTASLADLSHLQAVPYFMPYFIYAAGSLQLYLVQTAVSKPSNIEPRRPMLRGDGRYVNLQALFLVAPTNCEQTTCLQSHPTTWSGQSKLQVQRRGWPELEK